jgi:hypothetical protein
LRETTKQTATTTVITSNNKNKQKGPNVQTHTQKVVEERERERERADHRQTDTRDGEEICSNCRVVLHQPTWQCLSACKEEDFVTLVALPLLFSEYKQTLFFICKRRTCERFPKCIWRHLLIYEYPSPNLVNKEGSDLMVHSHLMSS